MSRKARIWISAGIFAGVALLTFIAEGTRNAWVTVHRWALMRLDSGEGEAVVGAVSIKPAGGKGSVDPASAIGQLVELKYVYSVNFRPYARIELSPVYESLEAAQAAASGLAPGAKIKVQISYKDPAVAIYFMEGLRQSAITGMILLGGILGVGAVMLGVWIWRGGGDEKTGESAG